MQGMFVIFNSKTGLKKEKLLYKVTYLTLFNAYNVINDRTNVIKYGREMLHILRECGERSPAEYKVTMKLATLYLGQSKYLEAKDLFQKALLINTEIGNRNGEAHCYGNLGAVSFSLGDNARSKEYLEKALTISKEIRDRQGEAKSYVNLGAVFQSVGEYKKAKECLEKALAISKEIGNRKMEASSYGNLGTVFQSVGEYEKAKECLEKALAIHTEIRDRQGEALWYENLGVVFRSVGEYKKAREYLEKALALGKEIGDRNREVSSFGSIATVFQSVGEYWKAKEYHEKALALRKEIGDKKGEGTDHTNLGAIFLSLGDNIKAKEYLEKALAIQMEIGDRKGEALSYENLGTMFKITGKYVKAKEYYEGALVIRKEIGDRQGESSCYENLGSVFQSVGEYEKTKEYLEDALTIRKEIGDKRREASCSRQIGCVFQSLGDYEKATEYLEKALAISKEIGDRAEEASSYGNLGTLFQCLSRYPKADEYLQQALAIQEEIGERKGVATCYTNLGTLFQRIDKNVKAKEYFEKALAIRKETGDRRGEGAAYGNLGTISQWLGNYAEANKFLKKALAIKKEIGDREGEGADKANLGILLLSLGDYENSQKYLEEALAIRKEIGDRDGEAMDYLFLGTVFERLGEYAKAEEYQKKGIAISEEIGNVEKQCLFLRSLAYVNILEGKAQDALRFLLDSVEKCEDLRGFLQDNDQFKVSSSDKHLFPYLLLATLLCNTENHIEALCVAELGRARALADLMSAQYSVGNEISADPLSWVDIERIMDKENNCTFLYASYTPEYMLLWILKGRKLNFRAIEANKTISAAEGMVPDLDDFFANRNFRSFGISPEEHCEDRSMDGIQQEPTSWMEASLKALRIGNDDKDNKGPKLDLPLCYKLIIAPVADLLDDPEIIIVPDRSLYNIPFAALPDESGKYLSETFRILIVPSLTTLKLIQDSPPNYHSQTGALIVGNPDVGQVHHKGRLKDISRLPCAEREANMVGEKLGVKPLVGLQATKQAVLQVINSVSLIHFAAHGDAERGEIALAPALRTPNRIPQEEDYLLTMSDISKVQLRAKLVVLSCCHSGRGQIKAEGVVGIGRAFLGSGARSVLVALWALEDSATEKFMSHFYEQLVGGKRASESLHEAMKWMRSNGYSKVEQWGPFMLIGDDVTFDFRK